MMTDAELAAETKEERAARYRSIQFGTIGNGKPSHLKRIPFRPIQQPDQTKVFSERPGGFRAPYLNEVGEPMTRIEYNANKPANDRAVEQLTHLTKANG